MSETLAVLKHWALKVLSTLNCYDYAENDCSDI